MLSFILSQSRRTAACAGACAAACPCGVLLPEVAAALLVSLLAPAPAAGMSSSRVAGACPGAAESEEQGTPDGEPCCEAAEGLCCAVRLSIPERSAALPAVLDDTVGSCGALLRLNLLTRLPRRDVFRAPALFSARDLLLPSAWDFAESGVS